MKENDSTGKPVIYLITDGKATDENFAENQSEIIKLIKIAVQTKVSLIQIREKNLSARFVFELVRKAVKITRRTDAKILVNDRADIALAARAHGVHLTSESLSAAVIRRVFPPNFVIGVSVHTAEEAEIAKWQAADFVTFSPIFHSSGKGEPRGTEKLKQICDLLKPFPVLALGGVNETNWREVLQSGASGFAAIRFLNNEANLRKLATDSRR